MVTERSRRRSKRIKSEKKVVVIDNDNEIGEFEEIEEISGDFDTGTKVKSPKRVKISQLATKIRSISRSTSPIDIHQDNSLWVEKYEPKTLADVMIHPKKLKDIKSEIESMLGNDPHRPRLLVLSGPSGSSKSTVTKMLANALIDHKTQIPNFIEWVTPSSTNSDRFSDFLNSSSYRTGEKTALILVEDLPNIFHEDTRRKFQRALLEWVSTDYRLPPLVICITECEYSNDDQLYNQGYNIENNFTAETILGKQLLNNPRLTRIRLNSINFTLSKKCLNNIVIKESSIFQNIPVDKLKPKLEEFSRYGDLRSSISALQFWSRWFQFSSSSDINLGKESSIQLFHAIGKCIFGSKNEGEQDNDTINSVMKDYSTRSNILKLGLLENYDKYNSSDFDVKKASEITDYLSLNDTLKPEDISLELSIRKTRYTLNEVEIKKTQKLGLNFPREFKSYKLIKSIKNDITRYIELEFQRNSIFRTFDDSNLLHGFLEPLINNNRVFKNRSKIHYYQSINKSIPQDWFYPKEPYLKERLGGPLKELNGDQEVVDSNDDYLKTSYNESYYNDTKIDTNTQGQSDNEDDEDEYDSIVESSEEDFGGDDTFEKELMAVSQRKKWGANEFIKSQEKNFPIKSQKLLEIPPNIRIPFITKRDNSEFLNDIDENEFDEPDF
ncbi:hypothetical protein WICMUC_003587 [Wickerhamomyces mucosus]|uniref:Checkpoint protein RAD24-like helical bundle domain-containing protein n=1 Tax=Wickerhamomyces mucosus TaxID=1378264 RepID=A0A9P8PLA1_9ASCO|nr:hypothetical protein WICMUC_003587 [Wickerhamomyces mucosus]